LVAGGLGGVVAAKLSDGIPYRSALVAALLVMIWSVITFASPLSEVSLEASSLVPAFVFPVPSSILGAYIYQRAMRDA